MRFYSVRDVFLTIQGEGYHAGKKAVFVRFTGCNLWDGRPEGRARGAGACAMWCDTDFVKGVRMQPVELLDAMERLWPRTALPPLMRRFCVLTGGEPLLQVDDALLYLLEDAGWAYAIETNGTQPVPDAIRYAGIRHHWITVSPKLSRHPDGLDPDPLALRTPQADELKVVYPGHENPHMGWTTRDLERLEAEVKAQHYFLQPQDPLLTYDVEDTLLHPRDVAGAARGEALAKPTERWKETLKFCVDFVLTHPRWRLSSQQHKAWRIA